MVMYFKCNMCACSESTHCDLNIIYKCIQISDSMFMILILIAITYILEFSNMHLYKKIYWFGCLMHAFDVNNGDDSDNESDNESGEDEEITHFVGSKNIGAAHEKNNQDSLEQAYIALWEDKIVQVYIRLLFGWIKKLLLWI